MPISLNPNTIANATGLLGHQQSPLNPTTNDKFWMVHGPGPTNYRHASYTSAADEARRLARTPQGLGKKFYVVESQEYHITPIPETEVHTV